MENFLEEVIFKVALSRQVKSLADKFNYCGDNPGTEEKTVPGHRGPEEKWCDLGAARPEHKAYQRKAGRRLQSPWCAIVRPLEQGSSADTLPLTCSLEKENL